MIPSLASPEEPEQQKEADKSSSAEEKKETPIKNGEQNVSGTVLKPFLLQLKSNKMWFCYPGISSLFDRKFDSSFIFSSSLQSEKDAEHDPFLAPVAMKYRKPALSSDERTDRETSRKKWSVRGWIISSTLYPAFPCLLLTIILSATFIASDNTLTWLSEGSVLKRSRQCSSYYVKNTSKVTILWPECLMIVTLLEEDAER